MVQQHISVVTDIQGGCAEGTTGQRPLATLKSDQAFALRHTVSDTGWRTGNIHLERNM